MRPEEYIGRTVHVRVDRPLGSVHPVHKNIWYSLNYGYVPDTVSGDGAELDAYILGVFVPVSEFDGVCIGIVKRRDDDDDKLVVVPEGVHYTDEQIIALTEFIERFHDSYVLR